MDKLIEELKAALDDNRTGLRDSSDTNKTRYHIIGLIYKAYDLGMESRDQEVWEATSKLQ